MIFSIKRVLLLSACTHRDKVVLGGSGEEPQGS